MQLICSHEGDGPTQKSDSSVYLDSFNPSICHKFYQTLDKKTVESYNKIQSRIPKMPLSFHLKTPIKLKENLLFKDRDGNKELLIDQISFQSLSLPSDVYETYDIKSKQKMVVSSIDYVAGFTIQDLALQSGRVDSDFHNAITEIVLGINNMYSHMIRMNMSHIGEYSAQTDNIQIQGINIKIIGYNNGKLSLLITDIARDIGEFICNNKQRLEQLGIK